MSGFENIEATELSPDEMNEAAGGVLRYKPLKEKAGFIVYRVRTGDTLIKLASSFKCSVRDIMDWNPKIRDKNRIYIDEYLYIRA